MSPLNLALLPQKPQSLLTPLYPIQGSLSWGGMLSYLEDTGPFPCGSADKKSACNAEDPGSIPESGISPGEWIGYPHQYSWASLVAQLVKDLPAMWWTWVQSLGWEDTLEKGKATHSSILAWRIPWTI